MALRIGCDLDGTLADMEAALQTHAERLFGPHVDVSGRLEAIRRAAAARGAADAPGEQETTIARRPLTSSEARRLWAEVRRVENFWMSLREIEPGAVASLASLARTHRWELLFITRRPATAGDTAQRQTQRWLCDQGFEHPSVFVVTGSRAAVAAGLALHAVVDDSPEHCHEVKIGSQARPVLVWRRRRASLPPPIAALGIDIVGSAAEAFDLLEDMSRRTGGARRLMARLRAAIVRGVAP